MIYSKPAQTDAVGTVGAAVPASAPLTAPLPWARTFAFSVISVAFAVCAHTSAEHRLPSWWLVAAAVPLVTLAVRPLAAAERRSGSLLAGLIVLQLSLHAVFVTADGSRGGGAAGWLCCGDSSSSLSTGNLAAVPHADTAGGFALSRAALVQLTIHLLAAIALAWALRNQERALWTRVRAASQAATRLLRASVAAGLATLVAVPVTLRPVRRQSVREIAPARATGLLVLARQSRRGPPVLALHVA